MNLDLHSVLDAAIALVKKANELGVAAEVALQAFHDKLNLVHEPEKFGSTGSFEALPPAAQAAVDEAVASAA